VAVFTFLATAKIVAGFTRMSIARRDWASVVLPTSGAPGSSSWQMRPARAHKRNGMIRLAISVSGACPSGPAFGR